MVWQRSVLLRFVQACIPSAACMNQVRCPETRATFGRLMSLKGCVLLPCCSHAILSICAGLDAATNQTKACVRRFCFSACCSWPVKNATTNTPRRRLMTPSRAGLLLVLLWLLSDQAESSSALPYNFQVFAKPRFVQPIDWPLSTEVTGGFLTRVR
jgi:hypothetical protein